MVAEELAMNVNDDGFNVVDGNGGDSAFNVDTKREEYQDLVFELSVAKTTF